MHMHMHLFQLCIDTIYSVCIYLFKVKTMMNSSLAQSIFVSETILFLYPGTLNFLHK